MFLPKTDADQSAEAQSDSLRRAAYGRIEHWVIDSLPPSVNRNGVQVVVQEVQCGDPDCAPIDTAIAILFPSGGRGMMGIPMEAKDVTSKHVLEHFPTPDVLIAWSRGEDADWPPYDDDDGGDDQPGTGAGVGPGGGVGALNDPQAQQQQQQQQSQQRPQLRFQVGQPVECRIGPDPITGWAAGTVVQLWYREPGWPQNSWAPYKIELVDGRNIFAPGDVDQIIRARVGTGVGGMGAVGAGGIGGAGGMGGARA